MPRIRSVHPGQWTDEQFVSCSPLARLLAIGLRNEADDNGIFEWKPLTIKMRLFPADDCDAAALLDELEQTEQIRSYEVAGKKYGIIRNFTKYQRPKSPTFAHPVPTESLPSGYELHPSYSEVEAPGSGGTSEGLRKDFGSGSESSPQRKEEGGREGGEKDGEGKARQRAHQLPSDFTLTDTMRQHMMKRAPQANPESEFEQFCNHHRAKGSRMKDWQAAWRTWVGNAAKWQKSAPAGGSDEDWMRGAI